MIKKLGKAKYGTPFKDNHLKLLFLAIQYVFDELPTEEFLGHTAYSSDLYFDEDQTTSRIVELLNVLLETGEIPYFTRAVFQKIHRDAKVSSIHFGIDKMPDMTLNLMDNGIYSILRNSLLIECKVIRKNHSSQTVKSYVDSGMARFINGPYSSDSSIAIMIAYTELNVYPEEKLHKYFRRISLSPPGSKYSGYLLWNSLSPWRKSLKWSTSGGQFAESTHRRKDGKTLAIIHFWLHRK